jgi:hypothetical protein
MRAKQRRGAPRLDDADEEQQTGPTASSRSSQSA